MPKYQFLELNQELNKQNFKDVLRKLLEASNRIKKGNNETKQKFEEMDIAAINDRLKYFIDITKKFLTPEQANAFSSHAGLNQADIRERMLKYWKNVLSNNYIERNKQVDDLVNFLNDKNQNKNTSLEEIKNRILPLIEENHRQKITTNVIDYIPFEAYKSNFEEYLNILDANLNDQNLKEIGDNVDNYKSIYDYERDDELSTPIYNNETRELINDLKQNKSLDGKALTDEEILEYEDSLNYANNLFGNPIFNIGALNSDKTYLDKAIIHDHEANYKNNLSEHGYDPNTLEASNDPVVGSYFKVKDNKQLDNNLIRNSAELISSSENKNLIKRILYTMKKLGFDSTGITGEDAENKVYGLRLLYDAGKKYKAAISSNDPNERKKAIVYAKEVKMADIKIKTVLDLIRRFMPLDKENSYAIPANVDSIRTEGIPVEYRLDYGAVSYLAAFNNIINLIKENNWDIDEFVEKPMAHIRNLYDENLRSIINPNIANKGLNGVDLIFNIGKRRFDNGNEDLSFSASRALEAMALSSKSEETRKNNYALYKAYMENVNLPYIAMQKYREKMALNSNLDMAIINPNVKFDNLGIKYYDAKNFNIVESKNGFDDVRYLKKRTETVKSFKERIDESILKYIKMEAEFVTKTKDVNAMHLSSGHFISLAQKAATKLLLTRNDRKDSPSYKALEGFIRNGSNYVNNLIDSIPNNPKYNDYRIVKEIKDNPIKIGNNEYSINNLNVSNRYGEALDGINNYINTNKARFKTLNNNFLKDDKTSINNIKSKYNSYLSAKRLYDAEVKKVYGDNYKGVIDNLANKKLTNAYVKQNNLLKELIELKKDNLDKVEEKVKDGSIPESYLMDRKIQFDNNNYVDIPLFRSEKPTRDDYIKFRYPNDFNELSNEEKDMIFARYNKQATQAEYDFFLRKYFEANNLTEKKPEVVDIDEFVKGYADINKELLEAKFLGADENTRKEISEFNKDFDEVDYLLNNTPLLKNFKANIDKEIIEQLKLYKDDNENELPKLEDVIDVAQELSLKYLLLIPNIDKNSEEAKEMNRLLIDGKGYIEKLIRDTNNELKASNQPELGITLNIDENEINNYAEGIDIFEKYYKSNIGNKNIPREAMNQEKQINIKLKEKYENYEEIKAEGDNQNDDLKKAKRELDNIKDIAKFKANELYRSGLVSNDYVKERMERIDNNNFNIPTLFEIDNLKSMDDYIRKAYPNDYNDFSNAEKEALYNSYKKTCEFERREFFVKKFLIERDFATQSDAHSKAYKEYLLDLENKLKLENQNEVNNEENIIVNNPNEEKIIIDIKNENIIDNEEIEDKKDINLNKGNSAFEKWVNNLHYELFNNVGEAVYNYMDIQSSKFDSNLDLDKWLDKNYDKFKFLGDELKNTFKSAKSSLDENDKEEFDAIINNSKYKHLFIEPKEELENNDNDIFRKTLKSDLDEKISDSDNDFSVIDYTFEDLDAEEESNEINKK